MSPHADPRLARGMAVQLAHWRDLQAAGHPGVGWKIGFNVPAAQEALGLAAPVVGHLTLATTLVPGTAHSLAGGTRVGVEPEVAVHVGADLAGEVDREAAARAIVGLAPALEVVDLDRPLDDLEAIVAANVFHRAVAFGPTDPARAGGSLAGVAARVTRGGREVAAADAAAVAGDLVEVVRFVAAFLGRSGAGLAAGDRIITGSLTPPLWVAPGDVVGVDLGPLGTLELAFTA